MRTPHWYAPYAGLPLAVEILFWFVLAITVSSFVSLLVLWLKASFHRDPADASAADFLWVFVVPALNEQVTIADSVGRLQSVEAQNKVILVVNDGSDDNTESILAEFDDPRLEVLHRELPNARRGKAAALNDAWRHLHKNVLNRAEYRQWQSDRVIMVIVDADGRITENSPTCIARHFVDERVAGVQSLVRIYNRRGFLTWAQDVEFSVFGHIFQRGRGAWGTANMGGNGQYNRLAALDSVAVDEGPWRHRLTEDQDIGIRFQRAGWLTAQDLEATVNQQGLNSLRRLYRQRTRWAQGAWEAMGLFGGIRKQPVSVMARVDSAYYLLTPALQLLTGVGFVTAVMVAVFAGASLVSAFLPMLIFYLTLSFGPGLIGLLTRGRGLRGVLFALVAILPYTVYSWIVFPVLLNGLLRMLTGKGTWAKTEREALDDGIHAELE